MWRVLALPALLTLLAAEVRAEAPAFASAQEVILRLRTAEGPALVVTLKALDGACRGKLRHELRDHPPLAAELGRVLERGSLEAKKAALDAHRCFTAPKLEPLLARALGDEGAVVAHAAEVAARADEPAFAKLLLGALETRREACLAPKLEAAEAETCVWLTYAPGALLGRADLETRIAAGRAAKAMLEAPLPKIREVAVETLASTRLSAHARDIAALLEAERKGRFAAKNTPELLGRFEARRKTLEKKGEAHQAR